MSLSCDGLIRINRSTSGADAPVQRDAGDQTRGESQCADRPDQQSDWSAAGPACENGFSPGVDGNGNQNGLSRDIGPDLAATQTRHCDRYRVDIGQPGNTAQHKDTGISKCGTNDRDAEQHERDKGRQL